MNSATEGLPRNTPRLALERLRNLEVRLLVAKRQVAVLQAMLPWAEAGRPGTGESQTREWHAVYGYAPAMRLFTLSPDGATHIVTVHQGDLLFLGRAQSEEEPTMNDDELDRAEACDGRSGTCITPGRLCGECKRGELATYEDEEPAP